MSADYLNTSHVEVYRRGMTQEELAEKNLNTSHVEVYRVFCGANNRILRI